MTIRMSRRQLIAGGVVSGIAVKVGFIGPRAQAMLVENARDTTPRWHGPDGAVRFRLDAVAKVTGDKTFSRDFRAMDMPGWPSQQGHAFLIRARKADRKFEGLDLSALRSDLKPDRLVVADDLARDDVAVPNPSFYGDWFFVPRGRTPRFLGQPVAMLIFHDFPRFLAAKQLLQFNENVVVYGEQTGPQPPDHYGAARFVRIGGKDPAGKDVYSPMDNTVIFGTFSGDDVVWPNPVSADQLVKGPQTVGSRWKPADEPVLDPAAEGMAAAAAIERDIAGAGPDKLVLKRDYFSQSIEHCAMEADNGNAWYDSATRTLHMVVATQSPYEVATTAAGMVSKTKFPLEKVDLKAGYTVGYGSKDHAILPYYCVIAGLYGDGRPVRLANDRFEQFQMGIKRHAFWMKKTLVVDKATGKFEVLKGEFTANGGGRPNFSFSVGTVGATAPQSVYYIPKSDHSVAVLASRAVEAGSMRGYGALQTMTATEMMVDEAAELLQIDAIDLRLRNVFRSGMKNTQGAVPTSTLRNEEILLKAKAHPLWAERAARKAKFESENAGRKYGAGFAQVQKDYGTGADGAIATLSFDPDGMLTFRHVAQELGTGVTTAQAVIVGKTIGRIPDRAEFAVAHWPEMPLTSTEQPYTMPQHEEDKLKKNPHWTPSLVSSSAASNSSYYYGHATRQAALALLHLSLAPAANAIWHQHAAQGTHIRPEDIRVEEGQLVAPHRQPLPFERVAEMAHKLGMIVGVSVHTFNRWLWAEASFDVPGAGKNRLPIDALSVKYGHGASAEYRARMTSGGFHFVERESVVYPPTQLNNAGVTNYATVATLAEVAVDQLSGRVDVLSHHMIVDCGTPIVPELVSGQIEGGAAMGIGHALHEYLPLYEDGPGNGTWNFNRYKLPLAKDVAVWTQTADVIAPLTDQDPPKGIAEVVMIPIIPAIANAVHHAIGQRFYEFPITPAKIRDVKS